MIEGKSTSYMLIINYVVNIVLDTKIRVREIFVTDTFMYSYNN